MKRTFGNYFGKKYKSVFDAGLPLFAEVSLNTNGTVYEFPNKKKLSLKNGKLSLNFKPTEGKLLIIYPEAVAGIKIKNVPIFTAGKKANFEIAILNSKKQNLKGIQPVLITLTRSDKKKIEYYSSAVNGSIIYSYLPGINEPKGTWKLQVEELASGVKTSLEWNN